jgi:hypothetical protein
VRFATRDLVRESADRCVVPAVEFRGLHAFETLFDSSPLGERYVSGLGEDRDLGARLGAYLTREDNLVMPSVGSLP